MNKKRIITRLLVTVCIAIMLAGSIAIIPASAQRGTNVKVKVGKKTFNAVFYDNKTSAALLKKLPVSYKMSELNGNEKYKYLKYDLPTDEKHVKKVKAGDIMLYGSDCLVVFYKSFNTSYDYTRVGRITNTKGLKRALGKGSVKISFSKKKVIALNRKTLSLTTGEKSTLKLKGAKALKVNWTTSDKTIAAVSKKGVVTAKKNGTATITAKYNNKKYKCNVTVRTQPETTDTESESQEQISDTESEEVTTDRKLILKIDGETVPVEWEDNESVAALRELAADGLEINTSGYGGFEQVGDIGSSLPRNDKDITTDAGDIMLYADSNIVLFYGSNSWAYTRLGKIDLPEQEIKDFLGKSSSTITLNME